MSHRTFLLLNLWFALQWLSPVASGELVFAQDAASRPNELFVRRILPLLNEKCNGCHGDREEPKGGLKLTHRDALMKGGDSQLPAIHEGNPDASPLYLAARRDHADWSPMPPKDAERLTPKQLEGLAEWIRAGSPWPNAIEIDAIRKANQQRWTDEDGVPLRTSGGQSKEWTERKYQPDSIWAYQPVVPPKLEERDAAAIDRLIHDRIPKDAPLAPHASPGDFLRRASLDLTGLPPTEEERNHFLKSFEEDQDQAVEALIERLLASPHYGERMAQHWLDVVRYADSSGFANDYERASAWRYRDYVVRAFNEDKPYDRFIREQIAGDEIDPAQSENLIATGFLRMGPWELTGMEVAKVARQRFLDDVTNSVGETFLAQPLQCARCHDHKFDPIPTRDYYAIQAVFATTQFADRPAPFLPTENTYGFDERRYLELARTEHQNTMQRLDDKALKSAEEWYREHQLDPSPWHTALEQARMGQAKRGLFNMTRNALLKKGMAQDLIPPRMLGWSPEEIGLERISNKGMERIGWHWDRYQPIAFSVYSGPTPSMTSVNAPLRMPGKSEKGEIETTAILIGGDPFASGPAVQPGVLSAISQTMSLRSDDASSSFEAAIGSLNDAVHGRRRQLAEWIADPRNPLTTRTIVNRIWMWHFDQAIAGNPNNFGSTGKKPTHPELLDWLADRLVKERWSIKSLHRVIMKSQAYRRATSDHQSRSHAELEPWMSCYAFFKPRRLSAEEIRDATLLATGELNRSIGGIPVRPEIHSEVAMQPRQVMGTFAAAWVPSPLPKDRHRRSLYALKLRGLVDPAMEVFNAPSPDFSCERRDTSSGTPQVFSLFHSKASHQRSLALAHRAMQVSASLEDAIDFCYRSVYGRSPSHSEIDLSKRHLDQMIAQERAIRYEIEKPPTQILRNAVEENTGERFQYVETLYSNRDFVSDLQPAQCSAEVRGLSHLCLVLLNSNEFLYVY